jgi:hypothetical protein
LQCCFFDPGFFQNDLFKGIAMKVCKEVQEWITEEIEQEIEKQETRCKSWFWPLNWLCSVVTFFVKIIVVVGKYAARIVCEIVTVAVSIAAMLLNALLSIPILGAIFRAFIRTIAWIASQILGFADGIARVFGGRTVKKLRIRIVPLIADGEPLATEETLQATIKTTKEVFRKSAGIDARISVELPVADAPDFALDVAAWCGSLGPALNAISGELGLTGSWFQLQTLPFLEDQFLNLIGIGNPVIVFVVREVGGDGQNSRTAQTVGGISLGPIADWVAVEASVVRDPVAGGPTTKNLEYAMAHEIVHALGIYPHSDEVGNLMALSTKSIGDYLTPAQVGLIRSSPKVTYL